MDYVRFYTPIHFVQEINGIGMINLLIREIFQEQTNLLYWTNDGITVDEQLFPSRKYCPFLQYMPNKPSKFGIKFWMAADFTSGYMLSIQSVVNMFQKFSFCPTCS